jgi:ribonuclease BN (tRNA processing enzyme)
VPVLARDADLLIAEATYVDRVPQGSRSYLTDARQAGRQAAEAGAGRLMLTHLWPDTNPAAARAAAADDYHGPIDCATAGLMLDFD